MTMELAIERLGPALRLSGPQRARRAPQAVRNTAFVSPPPGAGDPAVGMGGPARFIPVVRARKRNFRYGLVDALVTFVAMALLTVVLAGMLVEVRGAASAHVAEVGVTNVAPAVPHVAAPSAAAAHPVSNLI